jgi:hypothetical protein
MATKKPHQNTVIDLSRIDFYRSGYLTVHESGESGQQRLTARHQTAPE